MAKKSLASEMSVSTVESNPGAGLPVGFGGDTIQVGSPIYERTPYVLSASNRGQTYGELSRTIPDLQDGDPVLIRGEGTRPVKLNPFRFHLVAAFQHFAVVDSQGSIVKTTTDVEAVREDTTQKWAEHIESVVLVCLADGGLTPARCTFKTVKTNAVHTAIAALADAADVEEWGKRSPEHKSSLVAPTPYARFTATVTLKRGTGKSSGFNFVAANSFITPTGLADWQTIGAAFKDATFCKLCDAVYRRHKERIAEIMSRSV